MINNDCTKALLIDFPENVIDIVELFIVTKVNNDFSFAFVISKNINLGTQQRGYFLFDSFQFYGSRTGFDRFGCRSL